MKKGLLIPLFVLAVLAVTQLACITVNVYDGPPPAKPQVSAAQLEADRLAGEDLAGEIALGAVFAVGGMAYLSKLGRKKGFLYEPVYWFLLAVGVGMFAWGILVAAGQIGLLMVAAGAVALFLSAPWAIWGDRLFGV